MKVFKFFSAVILVILVSSFATDNLPKPFAALLQRSKMTFEKPKGFVETKTIVNKQMNYEYAMKYGEKNFEVRLAIRPLDDLLKEYAVAEKNKKPGDINLNPNTIYQGTFQAILMNISGGNVSDITTFRKDEAKSEFNADWGATTMVEVGREFGQNYKYCFVVALHKDNAADAYYFYLSDNKDAFADLMQPAFYSLRYK